MTNPPWPPQHSEDRAGNQWRRRLADVEPRSLRTLTPSLPVIARSSGVFHWTVDGRRLFDFTSGVLVTNLGHRPPGWVERMQALLGWSGDSGPPLNAYNAVTPVEVEASTRLKTLLGATPLGRTFERIVWAASGSEAIHKALWAALNHVPGRDLILATRGGFHGKKGLANAVTGRETDRERDARVRFIAFPMEECRDVSCRGVAFDPAPYRQELDNLWREHGDRIGTLITEPYLGGGGSYHPHPAYLQMLGEFCRERDILFILDEVQANFGRTGAMFAFEKYGVAPDFVVLGKSLGNGVPVAAVAGRADVIDPLPYGELSDTWSANPVSCAAALATLEKYADPNILTRMRDVSQVIEAGLLALKSLPGIEFVRGEENGMVWGIEARDAETANVLVQAAYLGDARDGIHLLGPLSGKVIRVAPPIVIDAAEAREALDLLTRVWRRTLTAA